MGSSQHYVPPGKGRSPSKNRSFWRSNRFKAVIVLVCSAALLASAVTVAMGTVGQTDSAPRVEASLPDPTKDPDWISTPERVDEGKALPCTGPNDPTNFTIFSAGSSVGGLPLTSVVRRCDAGAPADEAPANYVAYLYGSCEIEPSATGCMLPLQIHTWPACQRSLSDYSFEGQPMPREEIPALSKDGEAEVREINFALEPRIEVYTESSTIVIFAEDLALAKEAVTQLIPQEAGAPPASRVSLQRTNEEPEPLPPPVKGSMKGALSCNA